MKENDRQTAKDLSDETVIELLRFKLFTELIDNAPETMTLLLIDEMLRRFENTLKDTTINRTA